ncbi:uncharacterized protein LOC142616350 [Castanea sativa]|uniref:uncharacterized protein LOC142616350 n=1 Tax=Castanea sativa TaxID=21020 RepID=UPI003F64EDDA
MGKDLNSTHRFAHKACQDLMNQSQHIDTVVGNFTSEQIANNRLILKASIDAVRHLALQAISFRDIQNIRGQGYDGASNMQVINNICASCKRIEQLKIARASNIAYLIDIEELETRKGLNQMVTLQRPGDTR